MHLQNFVKILYIVKIRKNVGENVNYSIFYINKKN